MVKTGSPVFLFAGSDSYLKERAIRDLTSSLLGDSQKELDHKVFYAGEATSAEVLDHLNAVPFLASKRLVIIKELEKAPSGFMACLVDYIKKPLGSTCLILETSGDSILKDYPEISKYASVRSFGRMTGRETAAWIRDTLAARKKKIDPAASSLLMEMCGQDLLALEQELEKLAAFTGQSAGIRARDVEELVGKSLISSTFDLADAMGARKADEALRICRELLTAGKKEYEIIGLLCWHLKRLLKAKRLQSRGESDNRIAADLRVAERYRAGFFKQVSGLKIGQIKDGIRSLLEADLDIKRTRFDYSRSNLVLEFAIMKISGSTP